MDYRWIVLVAEEKCFQREYTVSNQSAKVSL